MSVAYDVVVVGLGGIGGQTALRLAGRGVSVLGLDAYRPPHTLGSSHGNSRVIREAYLEGLQYVPLIRRAYELRDELEQRVGRRLVHTTGAALLGAPDSETLRGVRQVGQDAAQPAQRADVAFQKRPDRHVKAEVRGRRARENGSAQTSA
jgi:sarcosine oxidase